jgi:hypothetical protein
MSVHRKDDVQSLCPRDEKEGLNLRVRGSEMSRHWSDLKSGGLSVGRSVRRNGP